MTQRIRHNAYTQPTGGWGSVKSLVKHATRQQALSAAPGLFRAHNKPGGYICTSCAWAKPGQPHAAEFCENGAKATFWDRTARRTTPEFFARHSLTELRSWSDYDLENQGRLTEPMRYDADRDQYVPVSWEEAFADIGAKLRATQPEAAVFYASGRASLEASYLWQLFARRLGTNNLPDSSNMCHETTSVALPQSIGTPVGTVLLEDFRQTDCILSFGQNVGTNAPRLLHTLQEVRERDVPVLVFNPLRERGWEAFVNPQRPGQMLSNRPTAIATGYWQPRAGGDIAVIAGLAKALLDLDDAALREGEPGLLDRTFIEAHTSGFDAFERFIRTTSWEDIARESGLSRAEIEAAGAVYARAKAVIAIYGMGLTQHRLGVDMVRMLVNLLLMRGHIGRPGAGICPIRGHSNVQGQRTVGISEKTALVPLEAMAERYEFNAPREDGLTTVDVCEALAQGKISAFVSLGGNFLRAVPDHTLVEQNWPRLDLSVQIATKLNRSHLIPAAITYLLPTLVRSEIDRQGGVQQIVTVEDSMTCVQASRGVHEPAADSLLSEVRIVAELARATLDPNPKCLWKTWSLDYGLIRDEIAAIYPRDFFNFNTRMLQPGGFARHIAARSRIWETDSGKAMFCCPQGLNASFDQGDDPQLFRLITLRSNDQFNTTIYGMSDRLRGIEGSRRVVMIRQSDRERLGLAKEARVRLITASEDGLDRRVEGLQLIDYDLPPGTIAGYYPECNPLIPLSHYAEQSKTPAAKSVPVRIEKDPS